MAERERERGRYAYRDVPIPYGPEVNGAGANIPKALGNPNANSLLGMASLEKYTSPVGGGKPMYLGTFVFPRTPFPYFFPAAYPLTDAEREVENKENTRGKEPQLLDITRDRETRATILIPCGHLPVSKPIRPRIWGGGISTLEPHHPPTHNHNQPSYPSTLPRPRRVYTDDSDLFLCAVHSGFVRWSAVRKARKEGKDLKVEVGVIRVGGRGLGGALGVGRFVGGLGERYWCGDGDGLGANDGRGDEDDGRTLTSAGWGSEHDGSGIEVLGAEFVEVWYLPLLVFDWLISLVS